MLSIKGPTDKFQAFLGEHPKAKIVMKGFGYLFSERMLKFLIGFFVHAMVARHLGPEHFGKLSYIIKTVNIFYTFSLFGVDEIIMRELMGSTYTRDDILKTVFRLRIVMALIGFIILGVFLLLAQEDNTKFTLLTYLYGLNIFLQAFNLFELSFQAKLSFKPLFWANNISYILSSSLRVLGVYLKSTVSFFLSTYIVGEVILKLLIQRQMGFSFLKGKYNKEFADQLSKASYPYFLSAFVVLLDQRLSFIFLERFRTPEELGNYSVAVTLVDLWLFLPTAVTASVFPTIITSFNGNKEQYKLRIQYLSDILVWLGIAFFAGVFITSDHVIHLLYGVRYEKAPEALWLYALTTIPVFFNLARLKWMSLEKNLNDWLGYSAFCLILNFVGHYFLVADYGIKGAILSFLMSQLIGNIVMSVFSKNIRHSMVIFLKTLIFPLRFAKVLR